MSPLTDLRFRRMRAQAEIDDDKNGQDVMGDLPNRLVSLFSAYVDLLGRFPDWEGFVNHFRASCPAEELPARIMESEEYTHVGNAVAAMRRRLAPHRGKRRVLLFGAFGNGNLGDRIMARIVADKLEESGDIICFAYSELHFAPYPFPVERRLSDADMPMNLRVMELFDAVVIGGGGLLSYPHEPLWDPVWPYTLSIPYGLLSCGVKTPLDNRLENLVSRASVASSRDLAGYDELAKRLDDVLLCADPVLSFAPMHAPEKALGKGRLFILRAPFCNWHRELKNHLGPDDAVAVFEAHMDHEIISFFDDVGSINCEDEFAALASKFEVVISERYHGVILSLLSGVPAYGLCRPNHADKIIALFTDIGLPEHSTDMDEAGFSFPPYDMADARAKITVIRECSHKTYRLFLDRLFSDVPKKVNLKLDDSSNVDVEQENSAFGAGDLHHRDVRNRIISIKKVHDEASASLQLNEEMLSLSEETSASKMRRQG